MYDINYLINRGIHPAQKGHKEAKAVLDYVVFAAKMRHLRNLKLDINVEEKLSKINKITESLWTFHKQLTDNEISY